MDIEIARALGVPVEEYIEKIELTTENRATLIIGAMLGGTLKQQEKAIRIFKLIK
tara:strand:- start:302 stop:466 length:165 start_codon:yes stop_codon:yes gene_type:complete